MVPFILGVVNKQWTPRKKTVELKSTARPSRIRRDPVRLEAERVSRNAWWNSREWEIRFAVGGVILFALGISALVIDIGEIISR